MCIRDRPIALRFLNPQDFSHLTDGHRRGLSFACHGAPTPFGMLIKMIAQRSQKFEAVTGGLRRSKILLLMHPSVERVFGNTIANAANPNSRKVFFVDQDVYKRQPPAQRH